MQESLAEQVKKLCVKGDMQALGRLINQHDGITKGRLLAIVAGEFALRTGNAHIATHLLSMARQQFADEYEELKHIKTMDMFVKIACNLRSVAEDVIRLRELEP